MTPTCCTRPLRSNTAAIIMFQISLSGDVDINNLWLAVVDISGLSTVSQAEPPKQETKTVSHSTDSAPPLKEKSVLPLNPLPRNKEVIMYLEKADL